MAAIKPELWRFGTLTEDKKLPVRFLDANNAPILLSNLYGYGVKIWNGRDDIILCGVNIEGYDDEFLLLVDEYTIMVAMKGELLPRTQKEIFAMTTIVIADPNMEDGYFVDHCDIVPVVYHSVKEQNNTLT